MTVIRPDDLARQVEDLKRRIKALEVQSRLSSASVGDGGRLRVTTGGVEIAVLGDLSVDDPDGNPQAGVMLRREDGTLAVTIYDPDPVAGGFMQSWGLWDRNQNLLASDDPVSGTGLGRPYLPFPMARADTASWPTSTSTSFVDTFYALLSLQHPYVEVWAQVNVAASTVGEFQLTQGADIIGAPQQVTGAVTATALSWVAPVTGDHEQLLDLHFAARRVSGAGAVTSMVVGAWGRQSP